ncbi:MAG: DUF2959 family protein [Bdellovibrionales bacterium]
MIFDPAMRPFPGHFSFVSAILLTLVGCQQAVQKAARDTVYSAYEMVGVEKRDLLKRRIADAKDEQKEASESFGDALERLRQMYGLKGGALEKQYRRLQSAYEHSRGEAEEVRQSIQRMDTVASDLFAEWEREIEEIQSAEFRSRSKVKLHETKRRYTDLQTKLKQSEARMEPVLTKMKDHVLFLKHNLNAQSVASLKSETQRIEADIQNLLKEMDRSIQEADQFIKSIE